MDMYILPLDSRCTWNTENCKIHFLSHGTSQRAKMGMPRKDFDGKLFKNVLLTIFFFLLVHQRTIHCICILRSEGSTKFSERLTYL